MVKTITLTGLETAVTGLDGAHAHVRNDGADIIYASKSAGIIAGADGVIAIPAGNAAALYGISGAVYLSGTGAATIVTSDYVESPFKTSAQSGGSGADEVARAAISSHAGNADIHVSADDKAAWNGLSNPNLLINPDFAINQRGITNASGGTTSVYIADRWFAQRAIISRPENGGISIAWDGTNKDNGWIQQKIETASLFGKTLTISADIAGERKSVTTTVPTTVNKTDGNWVDKDKQVMLAVSNLGGTMMSIVIFCYTATPITINNVKLEIGANATRYYPPDPASELAKCQRYYQRIPAYLPSRAAGVSANFIDFVYSLSVPMRAVPSVDLSALDVYTVNYSKQTGFDCTLNIISDSSVSIRATKTGHGLTDAIARPSAMIELSAEI